MNENKQKIIWIVTFFAIHSAAAVKEVFYVESADPLLFCMGSLMLISLCKIMLNRSREL